jgi:hypothetical protein
MKSLLRALVTVWLVIGVIAARPLRHEEGKSFTTGRRNSEPERSQMIEDGSNVHWGMVGQWQALTSAQRRAWNEWARHNPMLLDDGSIQQVSGRQAMTMVLRNRVLAGDTTNPATVPGAVVWLNNPLSLRDAGPFTENAGFVGFRAEQALAAGLKWFVWATPPLNDSDTDVDCRLQFVTCMSPGALAYDDLTPTLGPAYRAVNGSWDGPGVEGGWPVDTFIWFRVHQYSNGQLGPGVMMKGRIQVEL